MNLLSKSDFHSKEYSSEISFRNEVNLDVTSLQAKKDRLLGRFRLVKSARTFLFSLIYNMRSEGDMPYMVGTLVLSAATTMFLYHFS